MSVSFNTGQYFGSTSELLGDKYYNDYSKGGGYYNDYSKGADIIQHLSAMLENTVDMTNESNNRRTNQESTVADLLGLGNRLNLSGTNTNNGFGLSSLNIPNGSLSNSIYAPGSNMSYNNTQNVSYNHSQNNMKSFNFSKPCYDSNPLSKLLPQNWSSNWSNNTSNMRAIRAASPQIFSENCPSTLEQALLMGCETIRENRSSSPTESDTSGISSVSELSSISDLMNNLNIGSTVGQGSGVVSTPPLNNNNITCRPDDLPIVSSPFFLDRRWSVSSVSNGNYGDLDSIERAARLYRSAAAFCEPTCFWSGFLPVSNHKNPTYSCKVFLGGVPWDITEAGLIDAFAPFGQVKIEWPRGKDNGASYSSSKAGYNYVIFESEKQVKALLQACTHDYSNGGNWYYKISSRRMRSKEVCQNVSGLTKVQIIPWKISDSNFVHCPSQRLDPNKTIFVGALHGMLNAEGLAKIMDDLFGGVVYAGIDTDKHKYPIGSGRVTFNNHKSYMKAICTAFVEIKTPKFTKKIQLLPYIEDAICSSCQVQQGPVFCREPACYRYFCLSCWKWQHSVDTYRSHQPIMRNKTNR